MSGAAAEATQNRKERRAAGKPRPTTSAQRLAEEMARVHSKRKVTRREGESQEDYFARIRVKATRNLRHERRLKNRAASAARKANHVR